MNENQTDRVELVRLLVLAELTAAGVHAESTRTPQGLEVRVGAGVTDRAVRLDSCGTSEVASTTSVTVLSSWWA